MSPNLATVLAAAEALPPGERRELINLLRDGLEDLEGDEVGEIEPTLSDEWKQEIARRLAEYDAGTATTSSWEEVRARLQARRSTDG